MQRWESNYRPRREHPSCSRRVRATRPAVAGLLLVLFALTAIVCGQERGPPDPLEAELTAEALQARLAKLDGATDMEPEAKAQVRSALEEAQSELARAVESTSQAESFEQEAAAAPGMLTTIREELAHPVEAPRVEPPPGATAAQVDQSLQRAEQELAAAREQFEQLRGEQTRRGERRAAIDQQTSATKQRLSELEDALKAPVEAGVLGEARRLRTLAQRRATRSALRALEAELANYDARRELLPARIDSAGRRVTVAEKAHEAWQALSSERRRLEAEAATREAEKLRLEAARKSKALHALAQESQQLAELRSGVEGSPGTTAQIEAVDRQLSQMRELLNKVRERSALVRAKVEAAGLTNSMGLLLRKELEGLPAIAALRDGVRLRQDRIADLQYQMIVRGEERSRAGDIEQALAVLLAGASGRPADERRDLERVGRELLTQRRDLLTALLDDYEKLFGRLIELDTATRQGISATEAYRGYIESRILWVRSVTGSATPDLGDAGSALTWLLDRHSWGDGLAATWGEIQRRWLEVLLGALAIFAVMLSRFWSRGRIRRMAGVVERAPSDSFAYTARAFVIVLVRAMAFPALLWGIGWALAIPAKQPNVVLAAAQGLNAAAFALFAYELLRQVIHVEGLGEIHFRWPAEECAYLRRHLRWFIPAKLLTVFLVTALDFQRESDLWNDSLGRIAFVIGLGALGAFSQRVLRPGGPVFSEHLRRNAQGWLNRLRYLWYPLAVGLPVVLALTALRGYYYTALRLDVRLQAWIWLVLGLVLANSLFFRWLRVARRRLRLEERERLLARRAEAPPRQELPRVTAAPEATETAAPEATETTAPEAAETAAPESPTPSPPGEAQQESAAAARVMALVGVQLTPAGEGRLALPAIDAQTRHLFRSAVLLVLVLGTYLIWADVLPALRRLDQVQIYPAFELLPDDMSPAQAASQAAADREPGTVAGKRPVRITLADLGLAVLIMVFTVVAAKNIPGLLEILILQRLPLDSGARYAAISLTRYAIVLIGVPLGLGRIGISWDSVQWLAAALTFGLAFGLQEIFANFVSGLIILFERPIRVGDVVTIHGTSGVVTRIRMRATTITDFDRKELIVPNKEFVTGEVVNWVLTDAVVRVVIPVGLGYGEDVDRARRLMVETASAHPLVLETPSASCQVRGLGPSTFDLELWVFVASAQDMNVVRTDLVRDVHRVLTSAGVDLPYPQQDVHLRSSDPLIVKQPPPSGA